MPTWLVLSLGIACFLTFGLLRARMPQIVAGAFFGANLRNENDVYLPINIDSFAIHTN
ncbi:MULTISPECIES: hypothetical protein [unclassified Nostoc]|nr:hypothetical protein [Nostoc sp. S13]